MEKKHNNILQLSYDAVIFGFSGSKLKILLIKYRNTDYLALPGGFIDRDQDLDEAVKGGVEERTGLKDIFLEQFFTFGDVSRHNPKIMREVLQANKISLSEDSDWMFDRFITVAYYALINYNDVTPTPDSLSESIDWYDVNELPDLAFDHSKIVAKALDVLRHNMERKLVGTNLLPETFTMNELQKVYEAILDEKLKRTTFQKRMLSLGVLERLDKRFTGKPHKAPYLYKFIL